MAAPTQITLTEAAAKLGLTTTRRVRQLAAADQLKVVKVERGEYAADKRVRNLVSVRSLQALQRKRAKKGRRA